MSKNDRNLATTRAVWAAVTAISHRSLRSIMAATGITSTSVVADHLDFLQACGYIRQAYGSDGVAIARGRRVLVPFGADPGLVATPPIYAPRGDTTERAYRILEATAPLTVAALARRLGISSSGTLYHLRRLRAAGRVAPGVPLRIVTEVAA